MKVCDILGYIIIGILLLFGLAVFINGFVFGLINDIKGKPSSRGEEE